MSFTVSATPPAGQVGVNPYFIYITSTDTLSEILTPGYLDVSKSTINVFSNEQVAVVKYPDGIALLQVNVSADGVVTLTATTSPGGVILPVVSGNFAVFTGTQGFMTDDGFAPSNAALANVVMAATGSGVSSGLTARFNDSNGTIGSGYKLFTGQAGPYAGGGTSNTFTTPGLTTAAIAVATILTSTNSVAITKASPGTNSLAVTFSADPGAGTVIQYFATLGAVS